MSTLKRVPRSCEFCHAPLSLMTSASATHCKVCEADMAKAEASFNESSPVTRTCRRCGKQCEPSRYFTCGFCVHDDLLESDNEWGAVLPDNGGACEDNEAATELNRQKALAIDALHSGNKKCSMCLEVKPRTQFYLRARASDGRYGQCIACRNELVRKYKRGGGGAAPAEAPQ